MLYKLIFVKITKIKNYTACHIEIVVIIVTMTMTIMITITLTRYVSEQKKI